MSNKETNTIAEKLLRINIDKDINFHIDNFNKNGIKWNNKIIMNLVNKIKQEKFPNDDKIY